MGKEGPKWYTLEEAVKLRGVSRATILRRVREGRVKAIRGKGKGRKYLFTEAELAKVALRRAKAESKSRMRRLAIQSNPLRKTTYSNGEFSLREREAITVQVRRGTLARLRKAVEGKAILVEDAVEQMIHHCLDHMGG